MRSKRGFASRATSSPAASPFTRPEGRKVAVAVLEPEKRVSAKSKSNKGLELVRCELGVGSPGPTIEAHCEIRYKLCE